MAVVYLLSRLPHYNPLSPEPQQIDDRDTQLSAGQHVLHSQAVSNRRVARVKDGIEVSINLPSSREDRRQLRLATSRGSIEDVFWSSLRNVKENKN